MKLKDKLAHFLSHGGALRMLADVDEKHLQTLYLFACQCVKRGEVKTAERLFQQLFYLDSWDFDYLLSLGLCKQMHGAHQEALFCFARAGKIKITDPRPAYYAGISYQKLGNTEYAKRAYLAVLRWASNRTQYQALSQKAEQALNELRN